MGGANATVMALGDQLKTATDATANTLTSVGDTMRKSMAGVVDQYLGKDGVFGAKVDATIQSVVASLDPEKGAAVRTLLAAMRAESTKAGAALVTELTNKLNINDPNGPIGTLHRDMTGMREVMVKLQEQHAAQVRVDAVKNRTPLKGTTLEKYVESILGPLAAARGESLDFCGDTEGSIARCKAGDFLNRLDGSCTGGLDADLVVEAKNQKKTVGAMRAELTKSRQNRSAHGSLGVMAQPTILTDPIAVYDQVNVVVNLQYFGTPEADYDYYEKLLKAGFAVARLVTTAALQAPKPTSVDLGRIKALVDQLGATSRVRTTLKADITRTITAATNVRGTAEELDVTLDGIEKSLRDVIADEYKKIAASATPTPILPASATHPAGIGEMKLDLKVIDELPTGNGKKPA